MADTIVENKFKELGEKWEKAGSDLSESSKNYEEYGKALGTASINQAKELGLTVATWLGLVALLGITGGLFGVVIWDDGHKNWHKLKKISFIIGFLIFLAIPIYFTAMPHIQFSGKLEACIILWTFWLLTNIFIMESWGIYESVLPFLSDIFRNTINWFENSETAKSVLKIFIGLIVIALFVVGSVFVSKDPVAGKANKGVGIGLFFGSMIILLMVLLGTMRYLRQHKTTTKFYNIIQSRPNTFWAIFSLLMMGIATPLAFHYDNLDDEKYKTKINDCNNIKEFDGSIKNDTVEEKQECEEKARKEYYEDTIPLKEIPLMSLIIFLFFGFVFISRKNIFNFLKKDKFRTLIIYISLIVLISFIIFQIHSEKFTELNFRRTKTAPVIPDSVYLPMMVFYMILGLLCVFSLFSISWNVDNFDRPNVNEILSNFKWLFKKVGKYFKFLFTLILFLVIVGFGIFFYTDKRTFESGFSNLIFSMLGLALIIVVYKFLIGKDFIKNSKFFRILLNIVLLIPCLLFSVIDFLYTDLKQTPKIVYAILLGESILISLYVLVPIIIKYFSGHFIGKNNTKIYKIKKKQLEIKIKELKNHYKQIKSKVKDVINDKDWEIILENQYYRTKESIKNYLEKIRSPAIVPANINRLKKKESLDREIQIMSNNPNYRSVNKYQQVVDFIYYLITTQLPNSVSLGKVSVKKIKGKEEKYKLEKELVEEKIKIGSLQKSIVLVKEPIYLDKEFSPKDSKTKQIYTFKQLSQNNKDDFSYNYAISFWLNLHTQPQNFRESYGKDTNILNYGSNPKITYNSKDSVLKVQITVQLPECCKTQNGGCCVNGNPQCAGKNLPNLTENQFEVVKQWCAGNMTNENIDSREQLITIFEKEGLFKNQKWNNIVINYDLGILDIFVNSKLVGTWKSTQMFMQNNEIVMGENKGLAGGICNVTYYPSALTKSQIDFFYSSLKLNNPPII